MEGKGENYYFLVVFNNSFPLPFFRQQNGNEKMSYTSNDVNNLYDQEQEGGEQNPVTFGFDPIDVDPWNFPGVDLDTIPPDFITPGTPSDLSSLGKSKFPWLETLSGIGGLASSIGGLFGKDEGPDAAQVLAYRRQQLANQAQKNRNNTLIALAVIIAALVSLYLFKIKR